MTSIDQVQMVGIPFRNRDLSRFTGSPSQDETAPRKNSLPYRSANPSCSDSSAWMKTRSNGIGQRKGRGPITPFPGASSASRFLDHIASYRLHASVPSSVVVGHVLEGDYHVPHVSSRRIAHLPVRYSKIIANVIATAIANLRNVSQLYRRAKRAF